MKVGSPTLWTGRRWATIAAAVVVVVVIVALVVVHAASSPQAGKSTRAQTPLGAQQSARIVEHALAANGYHFDFPPYKDPATGKTTTAPDYGLTLDGILAMDSAGVRDSRTEKTMNYVASHIQAYVGDGHTSSSAGATAKALVVALSHHVTPAGTLGSVDLVARLKGLQQADGRFADMPASADYSSTLSQSLALVALHRAKVAPTADAIRFLQKQQCPNGGFRSKLASSVCTKNAGTDSDTTSFAVQGLLATPKTSDRAGRINKAIAYLKTQMSSGGGVKGAPPTDKPNANSTGLAVMSFDAAGYPALAGKGRSYLTSLRFGCAYPTGMRGAVAYDKARVAQAKSQGTKAKLVDADLRATTQALLGFSGESLLTIINADAKHSPPSVAC